MTNPSPDALPTLDIKAAALLSELERLSQAAVTPETVSDWLRECSQVKCELQTLWIGHLMTIERDTSDAVAQERYKHLMADWMPRFDAFEAPLASLALATDVAETQPGLKLRLEAEISGQNTEALRELLAQDRVLREEYATITSRQRINIAGEELLPHEAQSQLKAASTSAEREAIWLAIERADLATARELDVLFTDLLKIRQQIAQEAGERNYAEYAWKQHTRSYGMAEATDFLDGIAEVFAELTLQVDRDRAESLGVSDLRPWDVAVKRDPPIDGSLPLEAYVAAAEHVLGRIDPEFGAVVGKLKADNRFDLAPRPGKAGGNSAALYMTLNTADVMCNLTGGIKDFGTLLHELGHTIHWEFMRSNPKITYWDHVNYNEIAEFCAFVFAVTGSNNVYKLTEMSSADQAWYRWSMAEGFLARLREVNERVRIELWLYQQTRNVTIEEIDAHFLTLYRRSSVDWTNHKQSLSKQWQTYFLFDAPLYNIEYAIATIAAMLWLEAYEENPEMAIQRLKRAMSMGATAGVASIYAEAGIEFPFSKAQLVAARDVLAGWLA